MGLLGKTVLRGRWAMLDLPGQVDLLAEGDQELQGHLEPMGLRAESGHRDQRALRVFQDCPGLPALMDHQVFLGLSLMAVEICCVLQSVLLARLALQECLDSRVTQGTKEIRESSGKMERRVMLAHLVLQGFLALSACRVLVV